jgi:hypothetical protein
MDLDKKQRNYAIVMIRCQYAQGSFGAAVGCNLTLSQKSASGCATDKAANESCQTKNENTKRHPNQRAVPTFTGTPSPPKIEEQASP